jgi:nitrate reductase beta subunit
MPTVKNWQLGREMSYPYEDAHPTRQFAFVFNINRCIACQTCSMACKSTWTFSRGQEYMWWNNVETKPYGGYPRGWDAKLLAMLEQENPGGQRWRDDRFAGKTIFEIGSRASYANAEPGRVLGYLPSEEEWRNPNLGEDAAVGAKGRRDEMDATGSQLPEHKTWFFYLQRLCNHCTYPACLAACPRQAIYKRPDDGIVLIDQNRCRGYRKCVEACPYKKPMYRTTTRVSEKCIACFPRIEGKDPLSAGAPMETRCMAACVGKARMQGLVAIDNGAWVADADNPLYYLVKEARVGLPLYPQFGTEPNGYYIPPRWVPRAYLRQMFGPGVDHAIETYAAPPRRLMAVLQLFRVTQKIITKFAVVEGPRVFEREINGKPWSLYNDTVIAYDRDGKELIRITVEEPLHVRSQDRTNAV